MFGSNFKKFNSVLILFLVYISLKNITKFTDDDIEMPSQDYPYNLSQDDLSTWNSTDQENINIVLDEDKNLETSDLESEIKQSLKKGLNLEKELSLPMIFKILPTTLIQKLLVIMFMIKMMLT